MGILRHRCDSNILTRHDFKAVTCSVDSRLFDCFEVSFPVTDTDYAYIAVKPETKELAYYVDRNGERHMSGCYTVDNLPEFDGNQFLFFDILDEEITGLVNGWRKTTNKEVK